MISSVTNNKHNLCFRELQTNIFSEKGKIIANDITNVLLGKYPDDKKGRNFLERANHYNQDVYLTEDTIGEVRVTLFDRMWQKHPAKILFDNGTVGTYTSENQFTLNDILKKYNINERNERFRMKNKRENIFIKFILATIVIATLGMLIHNKLNQESASEKASTELVTKK